MIIIQVAGGLGNQMQQYALYRKFLSLGREAKLDLSWFQDPQAQQNVYARRALELSYFRDLPWDTCTLAEKQALVGRDSLTGKVMRKPCRGGRSATRKVRSMIPPCWRKRTGILAATLPAKSTMRIF